MAHIHLKKYAPHALLLAGSAVCLTIVLSTPGHDPSPGYHQPDPQQAELQTFGHDTYATSHRQLNGQSLHDLMSRARLRFLRMKLQQKQQEQDEVEQDQQQALDHDQAGQHRRMVRRVDQSNLIHTDQPYVTPEDEYMISFNPLVWRRPEALPEREYLILGYGQVDSEQLTESSFLVDANLVTSSLLPAADADEDAEGAEAQAPSTDGPDTALVATQDVATVTLAQTQDASPKVAPVTASPPTATIIPSQASRPGLPIAQKSAPVAKTEPDENERTIAVSSHIAVATPKDKAPSISPTYSIARVDHKDDVDDDDDDRHAFTTRPAATVTGSAIPVAPHAPFASAIPQRPTTAAKPKGDSHDRDAYEDDHGDGYEKDDHAGQSTAKANRPTTPSSLSHRDDDDSRGALTKQVYAPVTNTHRPQATTPTSAALPKQAAATSAPKQHEDDAYEHDRHDDHAKPEKIALPAQASYQPSQATPAAPSSKATKPLIVLVDDYSNLGSDKLNALGSAIRQINQSMQAADMDMIIELTTDPTADHNILFGEADNVALGGKLGIAEFAISEDDHGNQMRLGQDAADLGGKAIARMNSSVNWFTGEDADEIDDNQYDYQTAAEHEILHLIGLDDDFDDHDAVSHGQLSLGEVRRELDRHELEDLADIYSNANPWQNQSFTSNSRGNSGRNNNVRYKSKALTAAVPEPMSAVVIGVGVMGVMLRRRDS